MPSLKQHPHLVRLTAAVLIATVLQACTSRHARPLEPAQFSPPVDLVSARLLLADGSSVTVRDPVIRGDSLFGNRAPGLSPVALPMTSIVRGEVVRSDGATTALVVGGLVLVLLIVILAIACSDDTYFC